MRDCPVHSGTWDGYSCNYGSPILINLSSNSSQDHLTSALDGVLFDLTVRGTAGRFAWTSSNSNVAFLVLDRNGNGVIDNGAELFGNFTMKRDGTRATNGFDALRDLDEDGDGQIDMEDSSYSTLGVWLDTNHNGYSEAAELSTLQHIGVTAIQTAFSDINRYDRHGNWYRWEGTALLTRGATTGVRRIFDVILTKQQDSSFVP